VNTTTSTKQQILAQQQAAALRALADMIEQNPDLTDSTQYLSDVNVFYAWTKDQAAAIVRAAKASGFTVEKAHFRDTMKIRLAHGPVTVVVLGQRDTVCEKVVTTETVTRTVPDPVVLATVPTVEVTEDVETVEWVCKPLLATDGT
jgi:hypothetical protein